MSGRGTPQRGLGLADPARPFNRNRRRGGAQVVQLGVDDARQVPIHHPYTTIPTGAALPYRRVAGYRNAVETPSGQDERRWWSEASRVRDAEPDRPLGRAGPTRRPAGDPRALPAVHARR